MRRSRPSLTRPAAEAVAAQGLAFLAQEPARLSRFLALTGLGPDDVRARMGAPELLTAVLEHLAGDETLLLVFAAGLSVAPETIPRALALLREAPGGCEGA
jgi:hypothetical protein